LNRRLENGQRQALNHENYQTNPNAKFNLTNKSGPIPYVWTTVGWKNEPKSCHVSLVTCHMLGVPNPLPQTPEPQSQTPDPVKPGKGR
jgi:hypothetical protein